MTNNTATRPVPTAIIVAEGFTVRVIDNYAGDHNAVVKPGRYELEAEYRTERAEWTASGKNETRLVRVFAHLVTLEPERTEATVLYFGKVLATKVRPAHEGVYTYRIDNYMLERFAREGLELVY